MTFRLNVDQDVTCDFYTSQSDYNNATNIFKTVEFFKSSTQEVSGFDKDATYYFDCYSDDRTTTNWLNKHETPVSFTTGEASANYKDIYCDSKTWHRSLLLPNDALSSTWVVSAGINYNSDTLIGLSKMSAKDKSRVITIRRDGKGIYKYLNDQGENKEIELYAEIDDASYTPPTPFYLELFELPDDDYSLVSAYGPFSINDPYMYENTRTDTLIMFGIDTYRLILTRQ